MKKDDWRTARSGVKQFKAQKYSRTKTCRYALENKDGRQHVYPQDYCHAGLHDHYQAEVKREWGEFNPIAIINLLAESRAGEDVARRFYEWLFNYSPFSKVFVTKSVRRAMSENVIIATPHINGDILLGGLIASRMVTEDYTGNGNYRNGVVWHELVTRGVDPTVAFVVAHGLKPSKDLKTVEPMVMGHGTIAVGSWYSDVIRDLDPFIERLSKNDPHLYQKKTWAEKPGYGNVSNTWMGTTQSKVVLNAFNQSLIDVNKVLAKANNPFDVQPKKAIAFLPLMEEMSSKLKAALVNKENAIVA